MVDGRKPHEIGLRRPAAWRSRQFQVRESREIVHQAAETRVADKNPLPYPPPAPAVVTFGIPKYRSNGDVSAMIEALGGQGIQSRKPRICGKRVLNQLLRVFWMPSLPFLYLPPKGGGGACSSAG